MNRTSSSFADNVLTCVNDIADLIPRLTRRYDARVVVNAFAEHTSLALRNLVERGVCDAAQAQAVLRHVEQTAMGESPFEGDPEPLRRPSEQGDSAAAARALRAHDRSWVAPSPVNPSAACGGPVPAAQTARAAAPVFGGTSHPRTTETPADE